MTKKLVGMLTAVTLCLIQPAAAASKNEDKVLRINSEPPGASVIINGRAQGTTPFEWSIGHWAFDVNKNTLFSKHLSEPINVEIVKDGYRTETLQITRGPFHWHSISNTTHYTYFVINLPFYDLHLRPASRTLTNADVVQMVKGDFAANLIIDKIQTSPCEFRTDPEDIGALHNAGVPDAIISAMMHASDPQ